MGHGPWTAQREPEPVTETVKCLERGGLLPLWDRFRRLKSAGEPGALQTLRDTER